jgi:hypothetical protein
MNESKEAKFPPIPELLVRRLQEEIPSKCPSLYDSEREIFFYAGQRAVVEMLTAIHIEQQES